MCRGEMRGKRGLALLPAQGNVPQMPSGAGLVLADQLGPLLPSPPLPLPPSPPCPPLPPPPPLPPSSPPFPILTSSPPFSTFTSVPPPESSRSSRYLTLLSSPHFLSSHSPLPTINPFPHFFSSLSSILTLLLLRHVHTPNLRSGCCSSANRRDLTHQTEHREEAGCL